MTKQNVKTRKNTATISLPKPARKKSTSVKAKPAPKKQKKQTASKSKSNSKVIKKRNTSVAAAKSKVTTAPARKIAAKKEKSRETAHYQIKPVEKIVFIVSLILIIAFSCIYVATRVQTRTTRFEIADLKKKQIEQMKVKEELTKKISVYKRPEFIMKRATGQGMVKAKSGQIEWVK